jgi:hypothetical protein
LVFEDAAFGFQKFKTIPNIRRVEIELIFISETIIAQMNIWHERLMLVGNVEIYLLP